MRTLYAGYASQEVEIVRQLRAAVAWTARNAGSFGGDPADGLGAVRAAAGDRCGRFTVAGANRFEVLARTALGLLDGKTPGA